jgi:hypothetical protein
VFALIFHMGIGHWTRRSGAHHIPNHVLVFAFFFFFLFFLDWEGQCQPAKHSMGERMKSGCGQLRELVVFSPCIACGTDIILKDLEERFEAIHHTVGLGIILILLYFRSWD